MSNRVTLDQLTDLPIGEVANLPVEQLAMLIDDADELYERARKVRDWLNGALTIRYGDEAQDARRAAGKDTGIVRLPDEGFVVICDLPKKPRWDQAQLRQAVRTVESWGEDPREYVQFEVKVSEAKYKSWPTAIRSVFEPARVLETGRPSFRLQRKEAA